MAQSPDGSGTGPVRITNSSTSVTSGIGVTQKLVGAAIAFGNVLRGTFGPNGLDKMLYKTNGEAAVTNDGAKIVAELLVKHPAAKAFVSLAESQENACGDGVTGCIILASELMSEAGRLLERDIHPLVIVKGYQLAMQITLDEIENRSKTVGDNLEKVSRTALVGRSTEGAMSHLASLIAQSVNAIPDSDYERVRMSKAGEGTAATSELIPGILIEKRLALERMPKNLLDTKVAVLSCPLELESSAVSSEIEISTPEQYQAFIDEENNQIEKMIQKVKSSGAQAVFSSESIDSRALHSLADSGIFAMGGLERPIAEDVAQACGAALCDHLDDLSNSLGHADGLTHERLEGPEGVKERLIIEVGKDAGIVTILVGGTDGVACEETIRGMYDSLRSTCLAKEDDSILLGGGSLHMAASLKVREAAENYAGRERLSMEAFSRALEAIPAALATNTGEDRIDSLLELRSLHRSGKENSGITHSGKPGEISDVWIPTYTLEHAISAACESACSLLRVDQVISARGD
ncbi:MAG: TCP-1/cpn60 chaperonin family protein [Candidatus Thermoplasmatota archaeon]|nr:TCP-1/cpn60 chaperonin family protein [Candidatus Thermoplasmatota archaeon]